MKKRLAPKRKCKFNQDWRRDFAWIAKLPDIGMAQCNLCATDFSIMEYGLVVARMFAGTKRVDVTLSWRKVGPKGSTKGGMVCHLGESRPNAVIRHYSYIATSERAFSMVRKIETDF